MRRATLAPSQGGHTLCHLQAAARRRWIAACALVFVTACGGSSGQQVSLPADLPGPTADAARPTDASAAPPAEELPHAGDGQPPPPPGLNSITMFVNLGDSVGAGYVASPGLSYKSLLVANDDTAYPAYKGKDLKTLFPNITVVDKATAGAKTADVVGQAKAVPANPSGNTLVVVCAGGNDFKNSGSILDPNLTQTAAKAAVANLEKVRARFADKTDFPGTVTIVQLDVPDPTDGTGSIPLGAGDLKKPWCYAFAGLGLVAAASAVKNLAAFNQELASFAAAKQLLFPDNHQAFLGHGFHYDDPQSPNYQAQDPTLWFHTDCIHHNNRGHHELRRLIWKSVTGQ